MTTKVESMLDFAGKTIFRGTLIVVCSYIGASLATAGESRVMTFGRKVLMKSKTPNLVVEPDYGKEAKKEKQSAKKKEEEETNLDSEKEAELEIEMLQYEPTDDDKPILEEREVEDETSTGAEYKKGSDTVVAPSPGFKVKDEQIEKASEPEVSLAPDIIENNRIH